VTFATDVDLNLRRICRPAGVSRGGLGFIGSLKLFHVEQLRHLSQVLMGICEEYRLCLDLFWGLFWTGLAVDALRSVAQLENHKPA
jgi:hypothetical protein